jgi:hypothetical protein
MNSESLTTETPSILQNTISKVSEKYTSATAGISTFLSSRFMVFLLMIISSLILFYVFYDFIMYFISQVSGGFKNTYNYIVKTLQQNLL